MHTRAQYIAGEVSRQQYYEQFVSPAILAFVQHHLGPQIKQSKDEQFNDIPLKLWDAVGARFAVAHELKKAGDYVTQAGLVCIAKAAARIIKDEGI